MQSFYWGHAISPTAEEYNSRRSYFDFLFLRPYIAAAFIVTILGCGVAGTMSHRVRMLSTRPVLVSAAGVTLVLTLLASLVSDAGILLGPWHGPLILLHEYSLHDLPTAAKVFLPPSVLSGFAIGGDSRLSQNSK
jgi:hypothetical protein